MSVKNNNPNEVQFEDDSEIVEFEEFKKEVEDLQQDDQTLIRFFRARDRDIKKSKAMIVAVGNWEWLDEHLEWRKEYNIDSYLNWKFPEFLKNDFNFNYRMTGKDHGGRPVLWVPMGGILGKECLQAGHKDLIFEFVYHVHEVAMKALRESGHGHGIFIIGVENATLRQVLYVECLQCIYQTVQILEKNYPEVLKQVFILNAPWMFPMAYNFVKPVIAAKTISKIQVYNSDKSKWMPKLLKAMPIESIPEEYLDD